MAAIEKHGYKFNPGTGTFNIGGYEFNPETATEEQWRAYGRLFPQHFTDVAKEKRKLERAEKERQKVQRAEEKTKAKS